jgi:hypothetical protein
VQRHEIGAQTSAAGSKNWIALSPRSGDFVQASDEKCCCVAAAEFSIAAACSTCG